MEITTIKIQPPFQGGVRKEGKGEKTETPFEGGDHPP